MSENNINNLKINNNEEENESLKIDKSNQMLNSNDYNYENEDSNEILQNNLLQSDNGQYQ